MSKQTGFLKRIVFWMEKKKLSVFSCDVEMQKKFIERLGKPKDDIERSYFQYRCQMKFYGGGIAFIYNVVSFPLALCFFIKYSRNMNLNQLDKVNVENGRVVFLSDGKKDSIIPDSLRSELGEIMIISDEQKALCKADRKFLRKEVIRRYPFSWHFILKNLVKMARYRYAVEKYSPKYIIVCNEYSFTSSYLTAYCEQFDIQHIDVMHGEKLFYMRDSFFRYHRCYVWDTHYVDLLTSMGAEMKQFRVEIPASLKFKMFDYTPERARFDFTYYLQSEDDEKLRCIADLLEKLKTRGYKVAYRPHPVYESETTKRILLEIEREDNRTISIEQSFQNTRHVVSKYSTVLYQALLNGMCPVIDNLTDVKEFNALAERDYIMLSKEHETLSDYLN